MPTHALSLPQASLVALYGPKPAPLARLIARCQAYLAEHCPAFQPYRLEQIHGTLVGLERTPEGYNHNFRALRKEKRAMDLPGWLAFLQQTDLLPFTVQIGGFSKADAPFLSRGERPYVRSFAIFGDAAVMIGWPVLTASAPHVTYPSTLETLRRHAQSFGLLHTYHRRPDDRDNDFYFRLGLFDGPPPEAAARDALTHHLRTLLARAGPAFVTIGREDLYVASYHHETLPPETTRTVALPDFAPTPEALQALYG